MNKEWVLAKELLGVGGLPKTIQGIHKRANKEEWERQDVIQEGVKGRSIGYRLSSLPINVQEIISGNPPGETYTQKKKVSKEDLEVFFCALTEDERMGLIQVLARHGVGLLVELLDPDTPELLKLSVNRKKLALLSKHLPDEDVKEISERFHKDAKTHHLG